ncbi:MULTISPECIES: hypothetical protein [unclassified Sphingomonas]|uniref:hypothetical protein n=1 Tax=unclassified Sphingomonas TaxID=196159 RepID=UPI0006F56BD1|nr:MULTISPECIES: hypothetical protein [unclassified Sphingomonas]KQM66661.1 hypothetical protein ASE65_00760 [Sphingomonas sp. Leaf16]KQN17610.1 hypothetical protein ASE81_00140 [Sphingomonas sp. Leaf29]KQN23474.1 hypothetical protein ASE83_03020 [Sphingomonas sp. Leaf32]
MGTFGFGTLGKLVAVGVMAPAFYLVISQGAAERGRVEAVERSIVQARKDIRALETEFDTRANMAQLERWNGDVLALAAPRAEQYVGGEHQLASLPGRTEGGNVALAYVVPSAPMEMAAAAPEPTLAEATAPAASPVKADKAKAAVKPVGAIRTAAVIPAKARAVAMLDRTLLSDATIADLARSARKEAARP